MVNGKAPGYSAPSSDENSEGKKQRAKPPAVGLISDRKPWQTAIQSQPNAPNHPNPTTPTRQPDIATRRQLPIPQGVPKIPSIPSIHAIIRAPPLTGMLSVGIAPPKSV